ncbi:fructosyl amino acid oxidasesarcosine oxidase [Paecilomyces variotii]|uniref:Fructosyl amino acid oxidasesarcosine oxidase n=1 Tax=Byssochlamys spectabilis TaxID=264951 RepID=A0A443I5M9_BYSSP|nr:fructosyl amino acid oxidasesarcosine oxidase [Paecilomyces variotii]RWQ99316.1 fructosyl amino acid oxidasesarcosine oxidase [Paecilomyces variotii]
MVHTLPQSVLIVGAGVFGLSTALALSNRHPECQVTVLEQAQTIPNPHGSSVDTSRIVRADYANAAYAKLAADAIARWRTTDWGKEGRYSENGLVLVYSNADSTAGKYVRKSYENMKAIEADKVEFLPTKVDVERVMPGYGVGNDVAGGYVNWGSGWSDAEAGVRFTRELLEKGGKVVFKTGEVERVIFTEDKEQANGNGNGKKSQLRATGVRLSDNTTITADLIVLATGAWTPKLVDLRGKAQSTGQALAYIRITDEEERRLAQMPTLLSFSTGMFIIPPRKNLLKVARHAYGYLNPKRVPVPGPKGDAGATMEVSLPETDVPLPPEGEKACRNALREMLPAFADRPFCKTRVCWYTDTPKGDFIISYHPDHPGLFIATGGSGHGYKFLPVLGEKIVDAIEGNLEDGLRELWEWPAFAEGEELVPFEGCEDGSRSGPKGLKLMEELVKGKASL